MQYTANKIGKAWRPVHILFADSNHHNGFQYIHFEYNCQRTSTGNSYILAIDSRRSLVQGGVGH